MGKKTAEKENNVAEKKGKLRLSCQLLHVRVTSTLLMFTYSQWNLMYNDQQKQIQSLVLVSGMIAVCFQ